MNNKRTYTVNFRRKSVAWSAPVRSIKVKATNAEVALTEAQKTQDFNRETWHSIYRGQQVIAVLDVLRKGLPSKLPDLTKF